MQEKQGICRYMGEEFPYEQIDYIEGVSDAFHNGKWCRDLQGENPEALEWISAILTGEIRHADIHIGNYDEEFKRILKTLNKEVKKGSELAGYQSAVKKALGFVRRAIKYRYQTRHGNNGKSYPYSSRKSKKSG